MTEKLLVQSREWRPAETPRTSSGGLSLEFLEQVSHRLALMCLVFAGGAAGGLVINYGLILGFGAEAPPHWNAIRVALVGLLVLCLVTCGMIRAQKVPCPAIMNVGTTLEIAGAILLSLPAFWGMQLVTSGSTGSMPWVALWITIFPLVVPMPLRRLLVTTFVSATMAPAVFGVWLLVSGAAAPAGTAMVKTFLLVYLAAGIALVPAYWIYRLGARVSAAEGRARELGSYRLVRMLGKGGMGEVWHAEHKILARPAAVKLIAREVFMPDEDEEDGVDMQDLRRTALARFEREAKITSMLSSPHTIALYDFGVSDEGTLFYVMEMLEGMDLESLIEDHGPIPAARVIFILKQACCSLAEAHQNGLIHRDIKPANIYICRLGVSHDFVKVLDFGLVGVNERARKQDVRLTAEGYIVGTPAYMAPEMLEDGPVDGRADIYALGCVGYWLLTGSFVFQESTAVKMLMAHVKEAPDPPTKRLGKPIPPELEDVILACLEKDPAKRPQSACELAGRLAACDLGQEWSGMDARAWWEEHVPKGTPQPTAEQAGAPTETLGVKLPSDMARA